MSSKDEEDKIKRLKEIVEGDSGEKELIDYSKVEKIVSRLKKDEGKYGDDEEALEKIGLKKGTKTGQLSGERISDLSENESPLIRAIGSIYSKLGGPAQAIDNLLKKTPLAKGLKHYLIAAKMRFSVAQYLAITVTVLLLSIIISTILLITLTAALKLPPMTVLLGVPALNLFVLIILFTIPKSKAKSRASAVDKELPFALRHMATEIKAGLGLHKSMASISDANYGVLSDEFSTTLKEIEQGTSTEGALRRMAGRSESEGLKRAINHIIRALKTGGNLSDLIISIADDVSFELRMKLADFTEKLNFFGLIYIFMAIVTPVFFSIINAIMNIPIEGGVKLFTPLPLNLVAVVYFLAFPMLLVLLVFLVKSSQPEI
ncbi:MAG: type II secretion system F family protein [Candidatus Diapherotrites archaeon]|nr:type II secretion system F family protein [Candidatus Diapherotrites archaeon]